MKNIKWLLASALACGNSVAALPDFVTHDLNFIPEINNGSFVAGVNDNGIAATYRVGAKTEFYDVVTRQQVGPTLYGTQPISMANDHVLLVNYEGYGQQEFTVGSARTETGRTVLYCRYSTLTTDANGKPGAQSECSDLFDLNLQNIEAQLNQNLPGFLAELVSAGELSQSDADGFLATVPDLVASLSNEPALERFNLSDASINLLTLILWHRGLLPGGEIAGSSITRPNGITYEPANELYSPANTAKFGTLFGNNIQEQLLAPLFSANIVGTDGESVYSSFGQLAFAQGMENLNNNNTVIPIFKTNDSGPAELIQIQADPAQFELLGLNSRYAVLSSVARSTVTNPQGQAQQAADVFFCEYDMSGTCNAGSGPLPVMANNVQVKTSAEGEEDLLQNQGLFGTKLDSGSILYVSDPRTQTGYAIDLADGDTVDLSNPGINGGFYGTSNCFTMALSADSTSPVQVVENVDCVRTDASDGTSLVVAPSEAVINTAVTASTNVDLVLNANELFAIEVSCTTSNDNLTLNASSDGDVFPASPASLSVDNTQLSENVFSLATTMASFVNDQGQLLTAQPLTATGVYAELMYNVQPVSGTTDIVCAALGSDANGIAETISVTNATITLDNGINPVDPADGQTVNGTVLIPAGVDPQDVIVRLTIGDVSVTTTVDENGFFSFDNIKMTDVIISIEAPAVVAECTALSVGDELASTGDLTLYRGDTNDDGVINVADATLLSSRFGLSRGDADYDERADLNKDDTINVQDLAILAGALGQAACQPEA